MTTSNLPRSANILFWTPVLVFVVFYCSQSIVGLTVLDMAGLPLQFIWILAAALVSYCLVYKFSPLITRHIRSPSDAVRDSVPFLVFLAVGIYAAIIGYACATAEGVPLFSALAGAPADALIEYRETFLRTRVGWEKALNYGYVIFNNSVMPIVVTHALYQKKKWRYAVLVFFVFGLMLTLQKGAIASAMLPLVVLCLLQKQYKGAAKYMALMIGVIMVSYFLASGRFILVHQAAAQLDAVIAPADVRGDVESEETVRRDAITPAVIKNVSDVPAKYNIFNRHDQLSLMANRLLWIPYITAIDWLRYQKDNLNGSYLLGSSIKPVSFITGAKYVPIEREVSSIQWGQNATGTSSSNAVYFVDAYVNFGIFGIVFYSFAFAFAIRLLIESKSIPLIAAAIVPVWTACFVSLPAVFFSGGLAIFVIAAFLSRKGEGNGLAEN